MIVHILKKDLRLLWPVAAGSAALWAGLATVHICSGLFPSQTTYLQLSQFLALACRIGALVLAMLCVQQDPVPGTRGDWLSRPIPPAGLLGAKLLFCLATIGLPVFACDLAVGLANGHALADTLHAAAAGLTGIMLTVLPFVIIATVTETLVQALLCGFALVVVMVVAYMLTAMAGHFALMLGGINWIANLGDAGLIGLGALLILPLQYLRRRTMVAQGLVGLGAIAAIGLMMVPWRVAFAVATGASPAPAAAAPVQVAFDPAAGLYTGDRFYRPHTFLPVTVSAPRGDGVVVIDHIEISLIAADGQVVYHDTQMGGWTAANDRLGASPAHFTGAALEAWQPLSLPTADYNRLKNQSLRVRIDYTLTLFRPAQSAQTPIDGTSRDLTGFGLCAAERSDEAPGGQLVCRPTPDAPDCLMLSLSSNGAGGREALQCRANYTPSILRVGHVETPHTTSTFAYNRATDAGHVLYLTRYEPVGHFTRQLLTPSVKLGDWTTKAEEP